MLDTARHDIMGGLGRREGGKKKGKKKRTGENSRFRNMVFVTWSTIIPQRVWNTNRLINHGGEGTKGGKL